MTIKQSRTTLLGNYHQDRAGRQIHTHRQTDGQRPDKVI